MVLRGSGRGSGRIGIWKCWCLGEEKTGVPGEKPLGAKGKTNNKLNPHMASKQGFEPGPHWWEASALILAPSLAPRNRRKDRSSVINKIQKTMYDKLWPFVSTQMRANYDIFRFSVTDLSKADFIKSTAYLVHYGHWLTNRAMLQSLRCRTKVTWHYTWKLTLRRWIPIDVLLKRLVCGHFYPMVTIRSSKQVKLRHVSS